jgi:nicotinate phosphoribosyltransferase
MAMDVLTIADERLPGSPLLEPVMRNGRRVGPTPTLADSRAHAARSLALLPRPLRRLEEGFHYPVEIGAPLRALAEECDRRQRERG